MIVIIMKEKDEKSKKVKKIKQMGKILCLIAAWWEMELEFAKTTKKQDKFQLTWDFSYACFDKCFFLIWKIDWNDRFFERKVRRKKITTQCIAIIKTKITNILYLCSSIVCEIRS